MTIDKLRAAGHTLVEYTISQDDFDEMQSVFLGFANVASIPSISTHAKNCHEYLMPYYKLLMILTKLPDWFKRALAWLLTKFTNE